MKPQRNSFSGVFLKKVGKPLRSSVSLKDYSNFKIGGKTDYFFEAGGLEDLVKGVKAAQEYSLPYFILGGGNNILFDDRGFRGLILKNSVEGIKKTNNTVDTLSGTALSKLVEFCLEKEITGFEFLTGIPGTVGGAVTGNAGAFGQDIGQILLRAYLLNRKGQKLKVGKEYFAFGYRKSSIQETKDLILGVTFPLKKEKREKIKKKMDEILEKRKKRQPPLHIPCAGSYFKNPVLSSGEKVAVAPLLEKVGAKKLKVGGAAVHPSHANFIFNQDKASAQDVLRLAEELKRRIRLRFGLELQEEVIYLPAEI